MIVTIEIDTSSAAFKDEPWDGPHGETAGILERISKRLYAAEDLLSHNGQSIQDSHGETVGSIIIVKKSDVSECPDSLHGDVRLVDLP